MQASRPSPAPWVMTWVMMLVTTAVTALHRAWALLPTSTAGTANPPGSSISHMGGSLPPAPPPLLLPPTSSLLSTATPTTTPLLSPASATSLRATAAMPASRLHRWEAGFVCASVCAWGCCSCTVQAPSQVQVALGTLATHLGVTSSALNTL